MSTAGEDAERGSAGIRRPARLPSSFFDEDNDSNDSFCMDSTAGTQGSVVSSSTNISSIVAHLKAKGLNDDEEVMFEEVEVDDDGTGDEFQVQMITTEERDRIGADKFKQLSEIIKTKAAIQVSKDKNDVHNPIEGASQVIFVPPSDLLETLDERFKEVNNRGLKRNLNQYWQTYNYLRMTQQNGLTMLSKQAGKLKEIEERAKVKGVRKHGTVSSNIIKANSGGIADPEVYWRAQLEMWFSTFEWKREDGSGITKEELDREIEEYMALRTAAAAVNGEEIDIDQELADFMAKKGIIRDDPEDLDKEMDDYWSKKGQPMEEFEPDAKKRKDSGEKENDLGEDAVSKGWSVLGSSKPKSTAMQRLKARKEKAMLQLMNTNPEEIEEIIGSKIQWKMQQEEKKRKEEEERKKKEEEQQKKVAEEDLFAPDVLDDYDDLYGDTK